MIPVNQGIGTSVPEKWGGGDGGGFELGALMNLLEIRGMENLEVVYFLGT